MLVFEGTKTYTTDNSQVETSFMEELDSDQIARRVEEGFADEELGFHDDVLTSGWIQIGIGSSNNTSADLKSCQNSSYKRCIGVLRKNFPNILAGEAKPQEVTVSVTGVGTERKFFLQFLQYQTWCSISLSKKKHSHQSEFKTKL